MSMKETPTRYAVCTFAVGAALVLATPASAENATTVDDSTQPHLKSWSNVIPNAPRRFVVLADFGNAAVLDRETGLVWEQSPEGAVRTWEDAVRTCWQRQVGGRMGWHLPTIEELSSLLDPSAVIPGPALPTGHPFQNVQNASYWSSTTDVRAAFVPSQAWAAHFFLGTTGDSGKDGAAGVWCVRGGTHSAKY